ncbi:ABC transporter permease subunit [Psychrobacillus vulpis]|uniref:ABC transporter permease subunit n=1 Tax=Psychrobacillus vulpis TaxID=2325572 RepID=A0A544TNR8_9BACI|nr:ABC transporter permease subunit [Psychrobacillus vulpis]TQR19101.1 ABC transporter permease subunit [Psychrobacillus vulpis]
MKGFSKWLLQLVVGFIGILLISGLPILIMGFQQGEFRWKEYGEHLVILFPLSDFLDANYGPHIGQYIIYSLEILFLALIVATGLAILFTILTMLCKERTRQRIKTVFFFLESLPDILIILLVQLTVIMIHKNTGIFVSKIAVTGGEKLYFLPVFCLMILPMIQLYRLSMLTFEAEERKMYVELAKSLGFKKLIILLVHIFRNAIISIFFQSKKTMWFMLSNLFILELMFNMPGIMLHLRDNISGEVFLITVCSFFLPVFLLYSFGEWYFVRRLNRGGAFE